MGGSVMANFRNIYDEQMEGKNEKSENRTENKTEDKAKTMSSSQSCLMMILVLFVIGLIFWGVSALGDDIALETEDVEETWSGIITKSTYLYDEIDPDAKGIMLLDVGDRVVSAVPSGILFCLTNDEDMELCRVEVVGDGAEGWVLRKWID